MASFPWQSPYCAFDNNPILYEDPLGLAAGPPGWLSWVSTALDFVPIVGQIKAGIEFATGYTMDGQKMSASDRALGLISFIPGGALLNKGFKGLKKVLQVVNKTKVNKRVKKTLEKTNVRVKSKEVKEVVEKIHGNSKKSTKKQHVYEIFDKETGEVYKYGISGGKITKDGKKSYRATKQVNELNNKQGKNLDHRIIEVDIPGRELALKKEQSLVDDFARKNELGEGPAGNLRPQPSFNNVETE